MRYNSGCCLLELSIVVEEGGAELERTNSHLSSSSRLSHPELRLS